jgi:hypothetical protein
MVPWPDQRVLESVHRGVVVFRRDLVDTLPARRGVAIEPDHLGAHRPGVLDLEVRRGRGHHQDRLDAQHPRRIGQRLRVVARRRGNEAVGDGLARQRQDLVQRAPDLERAGDLQHLGLEIDLAPEGGLHLLRAQQGRASDVRLQPLAGLVDVVQGGVFEQGRHNGMNSNDVPVLLATALR